MGYLREPGSAAASILRIRWGLMDHLQTIPVPQRALFIPPPPNSPFSVFLPAFYAGVFLSMTLILAALLSAAATVRESRCLTATVRTTAAHVQPLSPHLPAQPSPVTPPSAAGGSSALSAGNRTLLGGGVVDSQNGPGWKGP